MSVSESTRRKHLRLLDSLTLLSRVSVAALLYLTSSYLPLFDASPHTVLAPSSTLPTFSSSLLRWDAFHFTAVAKSGYSREHHWAFFPGVPSLLRFAAHFSPPVEDPTFALARVALIHSAIAIPTTRAIYHLTLIHFRSPSFALLAALLSLLPASPVTLYFAPYAEPIFTFLSYAGMLACARWQYLRATLYFTVAAAFRSNGVLLALYVPWTLVVHPFLSSSTLPSLGIVFSAGFYTILPFLPSLLHQRSAYRVFCLAEAADHARQTPWCNHLIPSIYTYAQRTYWDVGFLSYWTLSQLPNIALALPLLVPILFYTIPHTLSLFHGKKLGSLRPLTTAAHSVHATFLSITLLTSAHTQIALRLLPALPSTYWAAATLLVERPRWGRAYVVWAVLWGVASVVLWAAFLPPA